MSQLPVDITHAGGGVGRRHPGYLDVSRASRSTRTSWLTFRMSLAVVELVEQANLKMVTNLVDYDKDALRIDMPVRVAFREVAPGLTLPLFAPARRPPETIED